MFECGLEVWTLPRILKTTHMSHAHTHTHTHTHTHIEQTCCMVTHRIIPIQMRACMRACIHA